MEVNEIFMVGSVALDYGSALGIGRLLRWREVDAGLSGDY